MSQARNMSVFRVILSLILLSSLISLANVKPVSADPGKMIWTAIDTPSPLNNIIVSPSEINVIAIGSDDNTFYAVDISDNNTAGNHGRLYKSGDGGVTWQTELSAQLIAAGAFMPVWNIAVAPDDVNFVVAVTDSTGAPGGPKQVYISTNGGATWNIAVNGLSLAVGEFISCVDISVIYSGTNRDIAIGTRTGGGGGNVYVMKAGGFGSWNAQGLSGDVVALKFSPTYPSDSSLVVISSTADTRLHLGIHDTAANTTAWDTVIGYPVQLWDANFAVAGNSPTASQIITADLELPSDFSGQDIALRRFYVSTDAIPTVQSGVYRVDDNVPHRINPPTTGRISSIAYFGTYTSGVLLAGEVTADPALGLGKQSVVNVWRTSNSTAGTTPTWLKSDANKSPTGGGNSGYANANAQVVWNSNGTRAYCGTSSACLGVFNIPNGTITCPEWPEGYLKGVALDESAFSVSPYAPAYEQLLNSFSKTKDTDIGNIWNQLSLIDTEMDFLTDVAALDAPQAGENLATNDYDILYLFSVSENMTVPVRFNSLWRSTSDPPGRTWERVLCIASDNVPPLSPILRVKQTSYDETDRSDAIVFANLGTDTVGYSANEGQAWSIQSFTIVTDLALASDSIIYILNDTIIYRYELVGTSWVQKNKVDTQLNAGHTIAVPLKNPPKTGGTEATKDMVLVGEAGTGRIVYADFSEAIVTVGPSISESIAPPVAGDAHVIFDDKFEQNGLIYNATHDPIGGNGKIYSWVIDKSTAWSELEPPNSDFYGLVQRNDVLYGAWKTSGVPATAPNTAGVDRTLYPRANVPPPPEWDYLVSGLPIAPLFFFNREPSSLKISSNDYNSLWAIDNRAYNFASKVGCLWEYTDILAKVGPWTTSPPSGSVIPVDPKSGRAVEVNFAWRQLSYSTVYEFQLAKDIDFHNIVLVAIGITPVDQLSPSVYLPAGALIPASGSNIDSFANLESGHTYYWRVRARGTVTGEIVRSPWSATMYFTVEAGLPAASLYTTVILSSPTYGAKNVSTTPSFSWSKMSGVTKYEFVLARDATLQQVVVKVNVPTTSYLYDGKLDYNTGYYWQVRAIEPVVSDLSPIGTFSVIAEEKPVAPVVEQPTATPSWVWCVIAVFAVLAVAMIVFTMVKPRYIRNGGGKLFNVEPIVGKPEKPMVKPANGKLDNLKPIVNKLKSRIARIWGL
ncbi:MAG: hypothetical protein WCD72_02605 [Dehalococcoidia bacterium]